MSLAMFKRKWRGISMDTKILQDLSMLGGGALMFLAYYVLLQAAFRMGKTLIDRCVDSFSAAIEQQNHSFSEVINRTTGWFDRLTTRQTVIDERNYKAMSQQLETLQILVNTTSRLETKLDSLKEEHHK